MGLIAAVAIGVGIVMGLVGGGRFGNVALQPMRGSLALFGAVVLQAAPQLIEVSDTTGLACVLGSYALLTAFALANLRMVGMPVVFVGLLANVVVIGINGGMPVRAEAIRTVDPDIELAELDFGAKRHLEDADDKLTFLGDILPVEPTGQVLSFGDLILALGVGNVVFRLIRPLGPVRRPRRPTVSEVMAMLPAVTATELPNSA